MQAIAASADDEARDVDAAFTPGPVLWHDAPT